MIAARGLSILMALAFACLATTASARSMRYPESGDAAFYFELPDDWTTKKDQSGNFVAISADHALAFSLNVLTERVLADEVARKALELQKVSPMPTRLRASIWGFEGVAYRWKGVNSSNVRIDTTLIVIQIDATHVAVCTRAVLDSSSPETHQISDWFLQDLRLSRPAP